MNGRAYSSGQEGVTHEGAPGQPSLPARPTQGRCGEGPKGAFVFALEIFAEVTYPARLMVFPEDKSGPTGGWKGIGGCGKPRKMTGHQPVM